MAEARLTPRPLIEIPVILLTAILAGIIAGLLHARFQKRSWQAPELQHIWLALVAFLPQFFAFYLPATRTQLPNAWVAVCLIASQVGLVIFCVLNRRHFGIKVLAVGLLLNLLVITANGGFMPMSTETARQLVSEAVFRTLVVGSRLSAGSKDVLLPPDGIIFPWLADRFLPPAWFSYRFAFSLGDVFIGMGAFLLLSMQPNWQKGSAQHVSQPDDPSAGGNPGYAARADGSKPPAGGSVDQQPVL